MKSDSCRDVEGKMARKICMFNIGDIYGKQTGGIKRFKELYFHLRNCGYSVDLYCASSKDVLKQNGINEPQTLNLTGKHKGFLGIPSHAIYLNNKDLYKKIKANNYDCVISFDVPSTIGLCLSEIKNIVYFVRQDLISYKKIQYKDLGMSRMKIQCLLFAAWVMEGVCSDKANTIITQCQFDLNQITKRHPLIKGRIKAKSKIQINNINPSWIVSDSEETKTSEKQYDLIFIGNFDDTRKGYKLFLDALDVLHGKGLRYSAVMLGEGQQLAACKKKYMMQGKIIFTGFVKNPEEYIKKSRLMVVPSYADSCPNTIMESLQIGVPVIGANSSGIPEILNNQNWRFDLAPEALSEKIQQVFTGNNLRQYSESQAKRAYELTFDWGEAIERIMFA